MEISGNVNPLANIPKRPALQESTTQPAPHFDINDQVEISTEARSLLNIEPNEDMAPPDDQPGRP